jgi:hypothetical protein
MCIPLFILNVDYERIIATSGVCGSAVTTWLPVRATHKKVSSHHQKPVMPDIYKIVEQEP